MKVDFNVILVHCLPGSLIRAYSLLVVTADVSLENNNGTIVYKEPYIIRIQFVTCLTNEQAMKETVFIVLRKKILDITSSISPMLSCGHILPTVCFKRRREFVLYDIKSICSSRKGN